MVIYYKCLSAVHYLLVNVFLYAYFVYLHTLINALITEKKSLYNLLQNLQEIIHPPKMTQI